jgi:hypothetical protein
MTIPDLCESFNPSRLFGVELEVDPVGGRATLPTVEGWLTHHDPSLSSRGLEYVMDGPSTWAETVTRVTALCTAINKAKVNLSKSGSLHIHISAANYSAAKGARLTNLYRYFGPAISKLVGPSRANNRYCHLPTRVMSEEDVIQRFKLDEVKTRGVAKNARPGDGGWPAVNLSYLGVIPSERSIEFRQNSPSSRAICVLGWASFCYAMVEICDGPLAHNAAMDEQVSSVGTLASFFSDHGYDSVASWIKWRHRFMTTVDPKAVETALASAMFRSIGVYSAARAANCSVAAIKGALEKAVERGEITKSGLKYRSNYAMWAKQDLNQLLQTEVAAAAPLSTP